MSRALFLLLSAVLVTSCGGADSHEKVAKDGVATMSEFTDVLTDIQDKESAEENMARLDNVIAEMRDLSERAEALGEPSEEEAEALANMAGTEEIGQKLMEQMMRIAQDPEVMAMLQSKMEEMATLSGN